MLSQAVSVIHGRFTAMNHATRGTSLYIIAVVVVLMLTLFMPRILVPWHSNSAYQTSYQYRTAMYRFSFVSCVVVLILWATTISSRVAALVKRCVAVVPSKHAQYTCCGVMILLLFYCIPEVIVQLYVALFTSVAGGLWFIFQGYVVLALSIRAHHWITARVVEATFSNSSNIQLFYLENRTSNSAPALAAIRLSRWLLALYVTIFCCVAALPLSMWNAGLFPSTASSVIIGCTILLGLISTCVSLTRDVSRGLLVPSMVILYATAMCLQLLILDAGNPHNTTSEAYASTSQPPDSVSYSPLFVRYSALLQSYLYINDVMLGVLYLLSAQYSAKNLKNCMFAHAGNILRRVQRLVYRLLAQYVCRWCHKYDKEETSETTAAHSNPGITDVDSSHSEGDSLIRSEEGGSDGGTLSHADDNMLPSSGTLSAVRAQSTSLIDTMAGSGSVGDRSRDSTTPTKDQMAAFYVRMLLLVAYTPLLLTRWGATDGAPLFSTTDLQIVSTVAHAVGGEVHISDDIAHQYFLWVLLVLVWLVVWIMYFVSMYSVYTINSQYHQVRKRLYLRDVRVAPVTIHIDDDSPVTDIV